MHICLSIQFQKVSLINKEVGRIEIQLIRKQQAVCKYNKINAAVCKYYVMFNDVFNIFGNDDKHKIRRKR